MAITTTSLMFIGIIWLFFFTDPQIREIILTNPDCKTLEEKYGIQQSDCEKTKSAIAYMQFIYIGTSIEIASLISAYIFLYNQLVIPNINSFNKDFFIMLRGNNVDIKEISRKRDIVEYRRGLYFLTKALSDSHYNRCYIFVENLNQPIYDLKRDLYKLNKVLYFENVMISKLKTKRFGFLRLQHMRYRVYQLVIDLDNEKVLLQPLGKHETPVGKLYKYSRLVKIYIYIKKEKDNIIEKEIGVGDVEIENSTMNSYEQYLLQYAMGEISLQQLKQIQNLELIYRFNLNPFYTFDLVKKVKTLRKNFIPMLTGKTPFPPWLLFIGIGILIIFVIFSFLGGSSATGAEQAGQATNSSGGLFNFFGGK